MKRSHWTGMLFAFLALAAWGCNPEDSTDDDDGRGDGTTDVAPDEEGEGHEHEDGEEGHGHEEGEEGEGHGHEEGEEGEGHGHEDEAGDVDAGDVDAGDVDAGDVDAGDVDAGDEGIDTP